MTDPIRVGVIGVGGAGGRHLRTFAEMDDVEVVAIADSNARQIETLCQQYGVAHGYTDYTDLLNRDDVDAISTATPNFLHEPIVVGAMERGKHALTEKPLANTLDAAERMVAASETYGRVLHMVYNHRYYNDVAIMKQFIDEGNMGRVYHARAYWMRRSGIPGAGNWFSNKAKSGGGPLIDLGVHVLDMALYLMGEPEVISVSAAAYAEHGRVGKGYRVPVADYSGHDVEDFLAGFIRFGNGTTITLDVSWSTYSSYGDDFGIAVYGTDGGGEIAIKEYNRVNSLRLFTDVAGRPATIEPQFSEGPGHAQVARNFIDAIRSGNWQGHHGYDALKRSRIVDACYRSAVEGREIRLG
ncbi:MAG: Gfo/Idh/MocA family oxidoreductase [Chloroflexota bacterium]